MSHNPLDQARQPKGAPGGTGGRFADGTDAPGASTLPTPDAYQARVDLSPAGRKASGAWVANARKDAAAVLNAVARRDTARQALAVAVGAALVAGAGGCAGGLSAEDVAQNNAAWAARLTAEAEHYQAGVRYKEAVAVLLAAADKGDAAAADARTVLTQSPLASDEAKGGLTTAADAVDAATTQAREAVEAGGLGEDGAIWQNGNIGRKVAALAPTVDAVRVSQGQATIGAKAAEGEGVLAATEGKVDDNGVRQALRDALDAAGRSRDSLAAANLDTVGGVVADVQAKIDAVNGAVQAKADRVAREAAEQAARERAAQEQAARDAKPHTSKPSTPKSSTPKPSTPNPPASNGGAKPGFDPNDRPQHSFGKNTTGGEPGSGNHRITF